MGGGSRGFYFGRFWEGMGRNKIPGGRWQNWSEIPEIILFFVFNSPSDIMTLPAPYFS